MTDGKIPITLDLTEREWSELIAAVHSKMVAVESGDYGDTDEFCDMAQWISDLERTHDILAEALEENGVTY